MALTAAVGQAKWTEPEDFHWNPWSVSLLEVGLITEPRLTALILAVVGVV